MKIKHPSLADSLKTYQARNAASSSGNGAHSASGTARADTVDISLRVQQMNAIIDTMTASPDIRQGRIQPIERQIDSGTYSADLGRVADKLLDPDLNARL